MLCHSIETATFHFRRIHLCNNNRVHSNVKSCKTLNLKLHMHCQINAVPHKKVWSLTKNQELTESQISEVVQMALSDHVAFSDIEYQYGLKEHEVVSLMRKTLRKGSYRTWRKRVVSFGSRRKHYKWLFWQGQVRQGFKQNCRALHIMNSRPSRISCLYVCWR